MFSAQKLHASLLKLGLQNHVYRCNLLLHAYVKSGALSDALKFLHHMPFSNVVSYNTLLSGYVRFRRIDGALKLFSVSPKADERSWNILISGFVQCRRYEDALTHFVNMLRSSVRPDNYTYAIIIPCCDLATGRQVHAQVVKICLGSDDFIATNFIKMCAEVGEIEYAQQLFDEMPERDVVAWNSLISCYSMLGMGDCSLKLFKRIVSSGMQVDEYTFSIILNEFASRLQFFEAMQVHSLIIRSGFCFDHFTCAALVNLYSKCGFINSAFRLFNDMPEKNVVSWTAIIVGLAQNGREKDAMRGFYQMLVSEVEPNSYTFGGLLSACASATAFEKGRQYHGIAFKFGLDTNVIVGSSLVDMYSKCGEMDIALRLFHGMPERDLISWNGMICGFAQNGEAVKALKLFEEMVQLGQTNILPSHVTFVGVLSACSHSGLISEGRRYFHDMISKYMIEPKAEHYTCMIDILARAGRLEEAEALILSLSFKPDSVMWCSLLGACKRHGNIVMARRVAERLLADKPANSSSYVLMANIYTAIGEWGNALEARKVMEERGAQKIVGCSWIEIRNFVHSFVAGQNYHPQIELIHWALQRLSLQMMDEGFMV